MRSRMTAWIVTLVGIFAFAAGMFAAPAPAEAACKLICCPGGPCITCCQAPCPTLVCPP